MTSLFLSLIDRIIDLVKLRETDRRQLFKEIIEPLFIQLQPVVDDYFSIFRRARAAITTAKGSQDALTEATTEIRQNREKMLYARRQVTQMAQEIELHVRDVRVAEFSAKVARFFYSTDHPRKMSNSAEVTDLCTYVLNANVEKGVIVEFVDETLRNLEDRWVASARCYAALRIHCMAPERYRQ
jgi:hypothetical protein